MRLESKVQIAKVTLNILTWVAALFLLGVLVLVLCAGLGLNPFRETTANFLIAAFMGMLGVAAFMVLLNVATNISLIADARIAELKIEPKGRSIKKWTISFSIAVVVIVGLVFAGTYLSKEKYLIVVRHQADEVLGNNKSMLQEIGSLLASGHKEDYKRINDIRRFLSNQRGDLPRLTIIYSGKFEDKLTFYTVSERYYYGTEGKDEYVPTYFSCTKDIDCDYLTKFFSGAKVEPLQKYTIRDNQFYIYIPYSDGQQRFVLLFDRRNAYGKIGS